jgi:hypothetical protein
MRHYDTWKHDYDFDMASGEFRPKAGELPMPGLETFRPV